MSENFNIQRHLNRIRRKDYILRPWRWLLFRVAQWLEPRHLEWCWAGLVMWADGYNDFRAIFSEKYDTGFSLRRRTCVDNPEDGAYCGRCQDEIDRKTAAMEIGCVDKRGM